MAKKRTSKIKAGIKASIEVKEENFKEKATSAAKNKKLSNSPKKDKPKTILPIETKVEASASDENIIWRELHFNKDISSRETLDSAFVFKDAIKSPRSSICDMQLNAMFETPTEHNGSVMHASLTNKGVRKDSLVSPMSRRPSRMSSFTSYSSVDNGYQINYSPITIPESTAESKKDKIGLFEVCDNRAKVDAKISEALKFCQDLTSSREIEACNTNGRWSYIPQCCLDKPEKKDRYPRENLKEIRELAETLR